MRYGSESRCLGQNEVGMLERAKIAMVRRMCGVKLKDKKSTIDLMQILYLNEAINQLAKANCVRWFGHVLRKDEKNFLRRSLDFNVKGTRKRVRPKNTWLKAIVQQSRKVWLTA